MDHSSFLDVVVAEAAALADAARHAGPDAATPATPEWGMAKLVKHAGTTHRWVMAISAARVFVDPGEIDLGLPDDPAGYPDWFEAGATDLASTLRDLDPATEMWSWSGDDRAGFWSRRMAHETTIHRWDAQSATAHQDPVPVAIAVDGIDERLVTLTPSMKFNPEGAEALNGAGETVHLHCTDADGEWLLRFAVDGFSFTREHAKGDLAIRGSASHLLLYLVGRRSLDGLEIFGDAAVLEAHAAIRHF